MGKSKPTCSTCLAFDDTHHESDKPEVIVAGFCRAYAPAPPTKERFLGEGEPDDVRHAVWPIVRAEDWCLEHSALHQRIVVKGQE